MVIIYPVSKIKNVLQYMYRIFMYFVWVLEEPNHLRTQHIFVNEQMSKALLIYFISRSLCIQKRNLTLEYLVLYVYMSM